MRVQSKWFAVTFWNSLNTQTAVPLPFSYEARPFYFISLGIEKFWGTCLMKDFPTSLPSCRLADKHNTLNIAGAPSAYGWGLRFAIRNNATSLPLHPCSAFLIVSVVCGITWPDWYARQLNNIQVTYFTAVLCFHDLIGNVKLQRCAFYQFALLDYAL